MSDTPGAAPFFAPRNFLPFLLVALIWGSTWLVIKDQVGSVPPGWSVTWRFALAAVGMAIYALIRRSPLRLDRQGQALAMTLGLFQFTMNFQFVYRAEVHLTSGIVAVLFALLLVPNTVLARIFLKQPVSRGFIAGSAVAISGIALLLAHEYRMAPPEGQVGWGVALALAALMSASVANVVQATGAARRQPMLSVLAWGMAWGTMLDALVSWALSGPPQFEMRWSYFGGIGYLAVIGSVVTFPIYFRLIRDLGAGRAAYNGVLVPVVAMLLSTLFEGYRWTPLAISGSVLALTGLVLALRAKAT